MINKEFDIRMTQALTQQLDDYIAGLPTNEELKGRHIFSLEFEKNKRKVINKYKQSKKAYYFLIRTATRKIITIILVILISLCTTVFSVKALREPVIRFFIETYEKFTRVSYEPEIIEELPPPPETIEEIYIPSYLPEEFLEVRNEVFGLMVQVDYMRNNDEFILFKQNVMSNITEELDTEGSIHEEIIIRENKGIFFSNKGWNTIVWDDGRYNYWLSSTVQKDELVKIAESVERK